MTTVRVRGDGELLKFRCLIHFDDGARVCVDELADGCWRLVEIVAARCPAAVRTGPSAAWRLVPYLIALFASTSAGLIWYLAVTQSRSTPLLLAAWASPFGLIFAIYLFSRRPRG